MISLKNLSHRVLIIASLSCFLVGCAAVDRATKPTAKSTSPEGTGPTIEQAQKEDYMGPKARVAVSRFEDKSAKGRSTGKIGDGMAEMLSNALFTTNRFIVLERGAIGDVIKEQDFGASGRVKTETAAKIGEIEGAELLIQGTITEFEPGATGAGGGTGGVVPLPGRRAGVAGIAAGVQTSHVAMIVKVIDAKTSRILASEQVEGKATDIGGITGMGGGGLAGVFGGYSKTPMEKAIRVAIEESVRLIVAKTPKEYYRVPPTPQPKAALSPPEKPTQPPQVQPQPSPQPQPQASLPPQPTAVAPPATVRITQVIVPSENLRDAPAGKIIGKVSKGTSLAIFEEKGNWLRVRLEDGREAWIWKASTSEEAKASPPPTTTPTVPKGKSPM